MDFHQEGDVGLYPPVSRPHYIENTGTMKTYCFWRCFRSRRIMKISLQAEWLAHTPARLVNEHLAYRRSIF